MKKLLFIYDKLMTLDEQLKAHLNLQFVSYALINGKLRWIGDTKQKRIMLLPNQSTTSVTYGGLFLCEEYEEQRHKLHSYYNNSIPYTNKTMIEDLYDFTQIQVTPILFQSIKDIQNNNYKMGEPVECSCFVVNLKNPMIRQKITRRWYRTKSVDVQSFLTLIKEVSHGRQ